MISKVGLGSSRKARGKGERENCLESLAYPTRFCRSIIHYVHFVVTVIELLSRCFETFLLLVSIFSGRVESVISRSRLVATLSMTQIFLLGLTK